MKFKILILSCSWFQAFGASEESAKAGWCCGYWGSSRVSSVVAPAPINTTTTEVSGSGMIVPAPSVVVPVPVNTSTAEVSGGGMTVPTPTSETLANCSKENGGIGNASLISRQLNSGKGETSHAAGRVHAWGVVPRIGMEHGAVRTSYPWEAELGAMPVSEEDLIEGSLSLIRRFSNTEGASSIAGAGSSSILTINAIIHPDKLDVYIDPILGLITALKASKGIIEDSDIESWIRGVINGMPWVKEKQESLIQKTMAQFKSLKAPVLEEKMNRLISIKTEALIITDGEINRYREPLTRFILSIIQTKTVLKDQLISFIEGQVQAIPSLSLETRKILKDHIVEVLARINLLSMEETK